MSDRINDLGGVLALVTMAASLVPALRATPPPIVPIPLGFGNQAEMAVRPLSERGTDVFFALREDTVFEADIRPHLVGFQNFTDICTESISSCDW